MELKDLLAIDLIIRACLLYDSRLNLHICYRRTLGEYLLLLSSAEKENDILDDYTSHIFVKHTSKASSDGTNNVKGGPPINSSAKDELSINFANFIAPTRRVVSMRFINGFTERDNRNIMEFGDEYKTR